MSSIVNLWAAVVAELTDKIPELKEVREYRGEFDNVKAKGKIGLRTPGALVYVSTEGVAKKMGDGRLKLPVCVSVAVICEDRSRVVETVAAEIAERIVEVIHENRFKVDGVATAKSDPEAMSIMNYNSDDTLARGLSVWGVAWEQAVIIGTAKDPFVPSLPDAPAGSTMGEATGGFKPAENSDDA